jgi:hypothetical protein
MANPDRSEESRKQGRLQAANFSRRLKTSSFEENKAGKRYQNGMNSGPKWSACSNKLSREAISDSELLTYSWFDDD